MKCFYSKHAASGLCSTQFPGVLISWLQHSLLVSIISWRMYAWKHHSSPFSKTKLPELSGKRLNYSSWIWSVEEAALLSGVTSKNREAAPCVCAEIKGIGIITESPAQSVTSGEVSEPRGRPRRGDGDSWQAVMPGGPGTWACHKRLTELTGFYPALPAPRTAMCDCHTALHTSAALRAPHKWSWWQMSALQVVKWWWSALAKLIPKGQWQKWE